MAELIKCSVCGSDVSSEAVACQKCGHGVAAELKEKNRQLEREKLTETAKLRNLVGKISIVNAVVVMFVFLIGAATYEFRWGGRDFFYFFEGFINVAITTLISIVFAIIASSIAIRSKKVRSIRTAGILYIIAAISGAIFMYEASVFVVIGILCLINIVYAVIMFKEYKKQKSMDI